MAMARAWDAGRTDTHSIFIKTLLILLPFLITCRYRRSIVILMACEWWNGFAWPVPRWVAYTYCLRVVEEYRFGSG